MATLIPVYDNEGNATHHVDEDGKKSKHKFKEIVRHHGCDIREYCACGACEAHDHKWAIIANVPSGYSKKIHAALPLTADGLPTAILAPDVSALGNGFESLCYCRQCSLYSLRDIGLFIVREAKRLLIYYRSYWLIPAEVFSDEVEGGG
jgi:hypothetical protein